MFSQQISVDASVPLDQLVLNNLVKGCVEISNITSSINGSSYGLSSYAYFNKASSNFPFQDGVMLSTGNAESGGNTVRTPTLSEGSTIWGTDPDLETSLGITNTLNATSIEFDLVSTSNQVQFNYLLASEEYFGINPCQISDGFVFLIKQTGSAAPYQNIALVPGTTTPVSTTTVHNEIYGNNGSICPADNEQYFDGYNLGDTNYNGRTVPLMATATIVPYVQYHIKLIIADYSDLQYDSAVFIEGISFDNLDLGQDIVTCLNSATLDANIQNPQATYTWFLNNNIISGATSPTLNATQTGTYRVEISVPLNNTICSQEDEIQVTLNSEPPVNPISDYELCDDLSGDATEVFDLQTKDAEALSLFPPGNYNLKYYYSEANARSDINEITAPISNSTNPQIIYVAIENLDTGCFSYAPINLVVNLIPNITGPTTLEVCDNDANPNGVTDINLTEKDDEITGGQANLSVSYHFTQADALSGNNPIISPYVTNPKSFFVRVVNTQTGCFNTTTLDVNITNSPIINRDTQYIDACDTDHDGFASFDLTQVINDVLQGLPSSGVTITFHETYVDADSGSNPILDPTNYLNTSQDVQTVFIRVEDNNTGCPTIVPIEVHTNLLLTGTNIQDFALCDEADNDGIADFYLNVITTYIANDLPNIAVTYYEDQTDLINNNTANALDTGIPFTATSPKTLYIKIDNTLGCSEKSEIKLLVNPVLLFQPVSPLQYCDDNNDGTVDVDLHSLDEIVNSGHANFEVHYFLTKQEAIDNNVNDEISFPSVSGTQTFYARIVNKDTGCHTENSFEIKIVPSPEVTQPSPYIICDNDQDGFSIVNLENKIPEIVTDPTGLNINFFTTIEDAEANTNPIANRSAFNSNTQNIFARVENTNSQCYKIATINIIVSTQPVFPTISNYEICEDGGDGKEAFLLSDKDNEILNGQAGKEVLYFEDSNYTIPIDKNIPYTNISSPQTIYVRVQNTIDPSCFGDMSFTILVSSNPDYNTAFSDYLICDDLSNDGKNVFDLYDKITEISEGATTNLNITFYSTRQNAEDKLNPLPMQYTNVSNPQTIYVRIEGSNSICYVIEDLGINIIAAPDVSEASPFVQCDTDYDGITTFNLNNADFQLLDRITTDLSISYFENKEDVEDITKEIPDPSNYTNTSNPQTVFIKVTNDLTGCYSLIPLNLIVNMPPQTNSIGTIPICDNNTNTYDLSKVNSIIVDNPNAVNISYHNSLSDAQNNSSPLPTVFNYSSNFYQFFARIEDPNTGCVITTSFNLQINPSPIANTPSNLEDCDDDYDGFLAFDLSQQDNFILGLENPNDFSVIYYTSQADANNGDNVLNNLHAAYNGEVIYARMENNSTGCFDTTSFSTIVNPKPIINIGDVVPLCNDTPLTVDASTGNSGDTYLWSTGVTTSEITIQPEDLGDYWVTVTTPYNCKATKSFSVIPSEEATINFTTTVDFADPNSITVDVSGIGNYVYILDDGTPQQSNVFDNVTFGLHTVTIRDLNGCQDVSKEVVVIDTPKFMTPNNDGDFDTWQIVGIEQLSGTVVYIYDRYGKLLKTLPSTSIGWDGTFNGHNMPSDDYWFVAKVKKDGVDFDVKGHFALKR